jgi:hypothetical protein
MWLRWSQALSDRRSGMLSELPNLSYSEKRSSSAIDQGQYTDLYCSRRFESMTRKKQEVVEIRPESKKLRLRKDLWVGQSYQVQILLWTDMPKYMILN